jgi:hypothetical protein
METKKQEKFRLVEESVLESVSKLGKSLNISTVSQKSKVSRPWIYKYFGSSADSIIVDSIKHAGRRFAELDRNQRIDSKNQLISHYREIILFILRDVVEHPWIPNLYFRYFGSSCEIGRELQSIESEFSKNLEAHCSSLGLEKDFSRELSKFFPKAIMASAFALSTDAEFKSMGLEKISNQLCRVLEGIESFK